MSLTKTKSTDSGKKKYGKEDQVLLKKVLRDFRAHVKEEFHKVYEKKEWYWSDETRRQKDKLFFTALPKAIKDSRGYPYVGYQFPEEFYERNEVVLTSLIHLKNRKGDEHVTEFVDVMIDVLGSKPNQKNLSIFFRNEVI